MATILPFRAWRPHPKQIKEIACPPYDVVDTRQARELAEGLPQSFLHVIRPEIDLPEGTAFNDESVYAQGTLNLQRFCDEGWLFQDEAEALYLYQLKWGNNVQTGIFGCVLVDEYDNNTILKHELTRPDKEDDRTRHILSQQAHAEPVMLAYKEQPAIQDLIYAFAEQNNPVYNFTAPDEVQHTLWKITNTEDIIRRFAEVKHFYIADGHHRCKSASRAAGHLRNIKKADNGFNAFPAVLFSSSEMNILAYNRLVRTIPDDFLKQLHNRFDIVEQAEPSPEKKGTISLYFNGSWFALSLPEIENANAVEKLDAHRLQEFILEPLLGITDQRQDKNISFIGGIHGTNTLEKCVNSDTAELAISMYPTTIEELFTISDDDLLMPPKSTWFEPKLRSGLLVHKF